MTEPSPQVSIGGVPGTEITVNRMALVLWGPAGWGKTTLAMTMPGRIALISFDPDGPASIPKHVLSETGSQIFDLSGVPDDFTAKFKDDDPLGLKKTFDHFDSYVIDSTTTIVEKTLGRGIKITKGATVERPSPGAYGARNALAINLIRDTLRITGAANKHVCFISHEGAPDKNDDGVLLGYTMALGGQMPTQVALRINECWPCFETSKNEKMIICRKSRMREPAKSRMFDTTKQTEFQWRFNPMNWNDPSNMRIDQWFAQWQANGFDKIPLPK